MKQNIVHLRTIKRKRKFNYYLEKKKETMYSLNIHTTINNNIICKTKKHNDMVELCINKNGSEEII